MQPIQILDVTATYIQPANIEYTSDGKPLMIPGTSHWCFGGTVFEVLTDLYRKPFLIENHDGTWRHVDQALTSDSLVDLVHQLHKLNLKETT